MSIMSDTAAPIACTLDTDRFRTRLAWIADLNARALRAARRHDLRLELDYTATARADIHQMIAQEQACCAFLTFTLTERPEILTLSITVPEAARDAAERLLAAFQEKNASAQSCGCTGGCGA